MYQDFAGLYDRIYADKDYAAESAEIARLVRQSNPSAQSLLDVACGTGGHLVHLLDDFTCEGTDLNPAMLEMARQKLPKTPLHEADMTTLKLPRSFDAVVCMFSAVGHLKTVERLKSAVGQMAAHLAPGGVLLIEPWIDPADWIVGHVGVDTFEDDEVKVVRMTHAEPVDRGRLVMEWLIGTKAGVTRLRDEHEMGWFTRSEYESAFTDAGLSVHFERSELFTRGLYTGIAS